MEPTPNLALARNKVVTNAGGDFLAFIDDDEFPASDWLLTMLKTCKAHGVAGVLGPVLPHFEVAPPRWLVKGGFYARPRHKTGFELSWQEARTGNVLIRAAVLHNLEQAFRPEFGIGGEDQDFFRRAMEHGHTFIWCDEAPVHESVPPHRWERRFLLRRALLRGKTTFKHSENRVRNITKSIIAVPLYAYRVALPANCRTSPVHEIPCPVVRSHRPTARDGESEPRHRTSKLTLMTLSIASSVHH